MPVINLFNKKEQDGVNKFISQIFSEMNWGNEFLYGTDNISLSFGGERDAFWLVKENGKLVGILGLKELNQNEGLLKRFYLAKEFRGQGLAQELLKKAVDFAQGKGFKALVLDTQAENFRAQKFYEKSGFKPFTPEPNKKWPESQHPEIFVFRKLEIKYFGLSQKSL